MKARFPVVLLPKSWFLPVSKIILGLLEEMADSSNEVGNIQDERGIVSSTCPWYYSKEVLLKTSVFSPEKTKSTMTELCQKDTGIN